MKLQPIVALNYKANYFKQNVQNNNMRVADNCFILKNNQYEISFSAKKLKFNMADADFIFNYPSKGNFHPAKIAQLLDAVNLSKNFRFPNPTMVTGPFLGSQSKEFIKRLKDLGIESVIYLGRGCNAYRDKCKQAGINYFHFDLTGAVKCNDPNYFTPKKNGKLLVSDDFEDKLKKLIKLVSTKRVYMGCLHGITRTNLAISLNYYLNKNFRKATQHLQNTHLWNTAPTHKTAERIVTSLSHKQKSNVSI
ncbi:MAG: hypothetical protein MJ180_03105 [Candidatus Gastranaerophilales bacterium]|nr:hypothetical protein [Candidatus Gastranaerophilales bacterium]